MFPETCERYKITEDPKETSGVIHYRCGNAVEANKTSLAFNEGISDRLKKSGCPFPFDCDYVFGTAVPENSRSYQIPIRLL